MLARARLPSKKTAAENAMLRQGGGRPMVAPTYSTDKECAFSVTRCAAPLGRHIFYFTGKYCSVSPSTGSTRREQYRLVSISRPV